MGEKGHETGKGIGDRKQKTGDRRQNAEDGGGQKNKGRRRTDEAGWTKENIEYRISNKEQLSGARDCTVHGWAGCLFQYCEGEYLTGICCAAVVRPVFPTKVIDSVVRKALYCRDLEKSGSVAQLVEQRPFKP